VAAETAFRKAIVADSNYAFAPRVLGILLSHLGRHEEARASIRRARELDPLSAMNRALSSQIDFAAGDADGAVRYAREAIIIDPEFWIGHLKLAQAYVELQEYSRALGIPYPGKQVQRRKQQDTRPARLSGSDKPTALSIGFYAHLKHMMSISSFSPSIQNGIRCEAKGASRI
jgi:tetratricopeptide (TPR) repeat protein